MARRQSDLGGSFVILDDLFYPFIRAWILPVPRASVIRSIPNGDGRNAMLVSNNNNNNKHRALGVWTLLLTMMTNRPKFGESKMGTKIAILGDIILLRERSVRRHLYGYERVIERNNPTDDTQHPIHSIQKASTSNNNKLSFQPDRRKQALERSAWLKL
jgi:hypothetical protein